MNQSEFDQLAEEDQRSATEIGIAMTILATRIEDLSSDIVVAIVKDFSRVTKLSENKLAYVLEEVGRALYQREWRFEITKTGGALKTVFEGKERDGNGDGEHQPVQEPTSLS